MPAITVSSQEQQLNYLSIRAAHRSEFCLGFPDFVRWHNPADVNQRHPTPPSSH